MKINHSWVAENGNWNRWMKQVLSFFLILGFTFQAGLASPLVFRVSKSISSKDFVELGGFDASKFRQIRISLKVLTPSGNLPVSKETAERELAYAKSDFTRTERLFKDGLVSKSNLDSATERLRNAQDMVDSSFSAEIVGVVGEDEVPVLSIDEKSVRTSIVIDTPPNLIRVKVKGNGAFTFIAWGQ